MSEIHQLEQLKSQEKVFNRANSSRHYVIEHTFVVWKKKRWRIL